MSSPSAEETQNAESRRSASTASWPSAIRVAAAFGLLVTAGLIGAAIGAAISRTDSGVAETRAPQPPGGAMTASPDACYAEIGAISESGHLIAAADPDRLVYACSAPPAIEHQILCGSVESVWQRLSLAASVSQPFHGARFEAVAAQWEPYRCAARYYAGQQPPAATPGAGAGSDNQGDDAPSNQPPTPAPWPQGGRADIAPAGGDASTSDLTDSLSCVTAIRDDLSYLEDQLNDRIAQMRQDMVDLPPAAVFGGGLEGSSPIAPDKLPPLYRAAPSVCSHERMVDHLVGWAELVKEPLIVCGMLDRWRADAGPTAGVYQDAWALLASQGICPEV